MKRWLHICLNLLSLVLFGFILWWGGPEAWEQLLAGDWRWLLAGLLLHGSVGMMSGLRLQYVAQAMGQRNLASWRQFYRLTMSVRALGLILPRSVSALGGKSVGLMAFGLSLRQSLWTVMVDNAMDVLFLTAVTLPAIPFLQAKITTVTYLSLCGLALLILAAALWWSSQPGRLNFLLEWTQRLPWLAQKLKLEGETTVALLPPPAITLRVLLLTSLLNISLAFTAYTIGRAVGTTAVWPLYLAIFPITQLSLIIAVAPGGLGIVDFTWAGLLLLAGIPDNSATTFTVALRIYISIFVLVWAGTSMLLALTDTKPANSPEIEYHPDQEAE